MSKLKVGRPREITLFVVYNPKNNLYLGENYYWFLVPEGAKVFKSRAKARSAINKEGARVVRWKIVEEIVE